MKHLLAALLTLTMSTAQSKRHKAVDYEQSARDQAIVCVFLFFTAGNRHLSVSDVRFNNCNVAGYIYSPCPHSVQPSVNCNEFSEFQSSMKIQLY